MVEAWEDGVLLAGWEMICAEADGDSQLTYGFNPAVGQRPDVMVRASLNSRRFHNNVKYREDI